MRNRFFFIILSALVVAAVGINFVHVYFFESQRLKLIDRQIFESSRELKNSPDFNRVAARPELVDDSISKVLRGARIGKVFIIRDSSGKIAYQSFNASLLNAEIPTHPEWVTVYTESEYLRVRNLDLPGHQGMLLQVGLVLDQNFLNWQIIDSRLVNYIVGIVLALFLASVLLTLILLSPLRLLIAHLTAVTSSLVNLKDIQPLPVKLRRYADGFWARSDEFSSLLMTVQKLIDRINLNYKLTKSWTLQMAHELKTPLAIIQAETESKQKANALPANFARDVIGEINQMSDTIGQFLDWAELENSLMQKDLYSLRIKNVLKSVAGRLEKISDGRIQLLLASDFSVFATPIHLDQLITNLATNALKFSPKTKPIELSLTNHSFRVKDYGGGIPKAVIERMGQPFNIGSDDEAGLTGDGLGLAWVFTVSKLYQWGLHIQSDSTGTLITVNFPDEERTDVDKN